jgi:hypothetical protein
MNRSASLLDPGSGPGWSEGGTAPGFSPVHCIHRAAASAAYFGSLNEPSPGGWTVILDCYEN